MTIVTWAELHNAYVTGRQMYEAAMQQRAAVYSSIFEAAHKARMERMAADGRQFREIILPAIKAEASLRAYERGLG